MHWEVIEGYNWGHWFLSGVDTVSDQENTTIDAADDGHDNSTVDALAAVAAIVIPAIALVYWLSGMPS